MIKTSVTLKNLDSVIKHLKKFEDEKLIQRALGAGLTKAAKPARQSLESKTPIDEHLPQNIGKKTKKRNRLRRWRESDTNWFFKKDNGLSYQTY